MRCHNILVTPDGQVKVLDFGLATGAADALVTQAATAVGTTVGMINETVDDADSTPPITLILNWRPKSK